MHPRNAPKITAAMRNSILAENLTESEYVLYQRRDDEAEHLADSENAAYLEDDLDEEPESIFLDAGHIIVFRRSICRGSKRTAGK